MELPIAKEGHRGGAEALGRAIRRAEVTLARCGAEETELDGATAFCDARRAGVRMLNFAADLHVPPGNESGGDAGVVVGQVLEHFAQNGSTCHVMHGAAERWPEELAKAVTARGYSPVSRLVFLLQKYQTPRKVNAGLQVVPARAVYGQLDGFFREMARQEHGADETLAKDFAGAMIERLDEPRLEMFVAREAGAAVGIAGMLTLGQVGVVMAAWSDSRRRGQGIGTTIMAHVLDHCARAAVEQVVLDRSEHCPAIGFYQRLGFVEVGRFVKYRKA